MTACFDALKLFPTIDKITCWLFLHDQMDSCFLLFFRLIQLYFKIKFLKKTNNYDVNYYHKLTEYFDFFLFFLLRFHCGPCTIRRRRSWRSGFLRRIALGFFVVVSLARDISGMMTLLRCLIARFAAARGQTIEKHHHHNPTCSVDGRWWFSPDVSVLGFACPWT